MIKSFDKWRLQINKESRTYTEVQIVNDWQEEREILIKTLKKAINDLEGAQVFYGGGSYDYEVKEYKAILDKIKTLPQ